MESRPTWATNRAAAIMAPSIPFGSINFQGQEEEENILASTSPTSYIQRMQRDMDRDTQLYQFSSSAHTNNIDAMAQALNPNPEAGRSAETALEIDDSDSDDDIEVVGIEAMM